MAGAGKKTFTSGEVLTASDVNGYLMDQAVMKFADSSARGSAIAAPSEGMVTYLDDENNLEIYDGSDWKQVGNAYAMATLRGTATFTISRLLSIVDGGGVGGVVFTFPAGRFTQPPIIHAQNVAQIDLDTANAYALWTPAEGSGYTRSTATTSVFCFFGGPGTTAGGSGLGTAVVEITAIQMSAGGAIA